MTKTMLAMVTGLLLLGGCARDPSAQEQPKDETAAPAQAVPPPAAPAGGKGIGVPECDEYFRQAALCFARNAEKKAQMEGSMDQLRERLTQDAQNPERRARLGSQCALHTTELLKDCAK